VRKSVELIQLIATKDIVTYEVTRLRPSVTLSESISGGSKLSELARTGLL
jgi:hypothetical protein